MKSILIKDTTPLEREKIVKGTQCSEGSCENCASCRIGTEEPLVMYKDYIDGKKEIAEINAEFAKRQGELGQLQR